ncbi:MAG: hypothetical protein J6V96_00875 [Aeriscardovia sp.]|nr:hypothetical protein [Aeriscardovia sp.]
MTRGRHAKPSKVNQKLSVGVIAGVTGLGTMFSMVPASFADTLPSNNESQNTTSSAVKLSGLQGAQISLDAASSALGSLALQTTGYQTQAKQQAVAENLSNLTKNLEGILHDTPYMSKLTAVQSGLDGVENTLKTPNLPNSDLQGATKTQGQLQDLVKQLQSIINDASAQYGTELKNAVDDYNKTNLPATEAGVNDAIKAAQSVYNTANTANNPDLASANNTFSTNAGTASNTAGSTSDSSTILGKAEALQQNAENQLNNINTEIKSYYNDSASPATGTLVTDAKNLDTWLQTWWSQRAPDGVNGDNNPGGSPYGYTQTFLPMIKQSITEVSSAISSDSTSNSADAATVLKNLKIMEACVEELQSITENSDLASQSPDEALSQATSRVFGNNQMGAESDLSQLVAFILNMTGLGGGSGTVPSCVPNYGGQTVDPLPATNPFTGTEGTSIWHTIHDTLFGTYDSALPEIGSKTKWEATEKQWVQDYANYKYLQSVQPYAQTIASEAQTALSKAQDAANEIAAAKRLADQNTGDSASDAAAAAQAKADIQSALQDVAAANSAGEAIKTAMSSAATQYSDATGSTPTVTIDGQTVTLPEATNEDPLYSSSDMGAINSDFSNYVKQANNLLSGSDSGTGTGGLLGDATAWQKAIVTQGVFNDAQKAYNAIQGVQQDLKNVESAANPGAAINSLNKLQSDLTPLINDTQSAVSGMQNGNQTIQGLGLAAPYSQSDISDAQTPLTSALPLASASNASNPIQKAIVNGNDYNFAHPIVVGLTNLEPTIHALIGQGSEPGTAQKILALPFQVLSAMGSSQGAMTGMPSGGAVHVQSAKPADDLASTGSDAVAAAIGAATLLAAGVAAELLKKKGLKREK